MKQSTLCWSSGKDSAMAFYHAQKDPNIRILSLMTTLSEEYDRINMHGIRKELLKAQVSQLDLPLELVYIPADCSNELYNKIMEKKMKELKRDGVDSLIFGDIFLEDIRAYREKNLSKIGINAIFPLWKSSTNDLAQIFLSLGFKAVISCIDSEFLDKSFIGRQYNYDLLSDLPENVDPCGENGEFHTFVSDGPIFKKPIKYSLGKVLFRDNRFYFVDLLV